jgi:ABC-type glycerol-3-phosphate transport system substrate-binding protein
MPFKRFHLLRYALVLLILITAAPFPVRSAILDLETSPGAGSSTLAHLPKDPVSVIEIPADNYGIPLADHPLAQSYSKTSVLLQAGDQVRFLAKIPESGLYTISFDMIAIESFINGPEGQLRIDGNYPCEDARRIVFPLYYRNTSNEFPLDRYGNDALIRQEHLFRWTRVAMRDANFSLPYPLQIQLSQGEHSFEFSLTQEAMLLGSIYLESFSEYPDSIEYLQNNPAPDSKGVSIELEAEFPAYKNDTSIRPISTRSLEVTPYDTYRLLLNTLGGESWERSGSTVFYEFTVPQDGMYSISLRWLQNTKNNLTVFRRITIDDQVPFAELNEVAFGYSSQWSNMTLGGETPYKLYLTKGAHTLGIEATNSPYHPAIEKIQKVLIDINDLSLEIRKLTGNQVDPFKEWVLTDYIPDIQERLTAIADDLQADMDGLLAINKTGGSQEILMYQMAIDNIRFLALEPDKIPMRMNRFSTGSGSAAQLLGKILPSLQSQPLALDKIYIHSPDNQPVPIKVSLITMVVDGVKRFINSFKKDPYLSIGAQEGEVEVWVNRPRQYVDLMQLMTDQTFTKETGIVVKFSIMPNESKLVLANAAGIEPDVALGVSTNIPYELAIRNALKDLRSFEDFDSLIGIYSPGSLLHYIINDSVYAIPEAQDFWVTFYRKDILDFLGIPVPDTWDDVIEILPELQRYGMNFNTPLSSGAGLKGYLVTAPYIFNHGAELYSEDGFSTGLESVPFGVSNFTDYLKLLTAAPEIDGLWAIDLYPATVLEDGTKLRYATGSAQACIMFANSDLPQESWEFMKWWMSTETQVDFQEQLILNYGLEYLWNSANVEAFSYSPIPEEHKEVILEQWEWLQEPVKLPGSYMQERELSNVWNEIVFDGENPRIAIDKSIIIINREITRKMEEFGYIQNGVKVKEFRVPSIELVESWIEEAR